MPTIIASKFEGTGSFNKVAELRMSIGSGVKVRCEYGQTLTNPAQGHPSLLIVQLCDCGADKRHGSGRRASDGSRSLIGTLRLIGSRRFRDKIFGIDEAMAGLSETLRRLLFAEAIDIDSMLPDARRQPRKVAIGRYQAEAIEPTAVQKIHGVDDESNVGSVLAGRVGKILMRHDRMFGQNVGPRFQSRSGKVSVDTANAGFADLGNLFEESRRDTRRSIVGIDKYSEAGRAGFGHGTTMPHAETESHLPVGCA